MHELHNDADEKESFRIHDLGSLEWAFKRFAEAKKEVDEYEAFYMSEKQKLDNWLEEVQKAPKNEMAYFEGLIIEYARRQREERDKKTVISPSGRVTSRRSPATIQQVDEKKLTKYALDNEIEEAFKIELDWPKLKKMLTITDDGRVINAETGEVVEGAKVKPETINYKVEVSE